MATPAVPPKEDLITLHDGSERIEKEGIQPFLQLIETGESKFFKAREFVSLYDIIFKMCIQREPNNWSQDMYKKYTETISVHLKTKVLPKLQEAKESNYRPGFLKVWADRWSKENLVVQGLAKLFMYLDRFYTTGNNALPLKDQAYKLYKDLVFDQYADYAAECILQCIDAERKGESQDEDLLAESVKVFQAMGSNIGNSPEQKLRLYREFLEQKIIAAASEYFSKFSRVWMTQDSAPAYLQKVDKCLQAEDYRVKKYLHPTTLDVLIKECYLRLLRDHQRDLLQKNTGLNSMLEENREADLGRLFRLYSRYQPRAAAAETKEAKYPVSSAQAAVDKDTQDDLIPIATLFGAHISRAGAAIVDQGKAAPADTKETGSDQKAPAGANPADAGNSLVQQLIDLHALYGGMVKRAFNNHGLFQKALKSSFEEFVNRDQRLSKLLAGFAHDALKKHSRVNATEVMLDNIVFLYGYLSDKDVFERDYQHFLAIRLLLGQCESDKSEERMISKLKSECGYQWTNKLEGMFKDVATSSDRMRDFAKFYDTVERLQLSLNVTVCTTGNWPSSKAVAGRLPQELQKACEEFKRFYLNSHQGHRLDWHLDQGQAQVQVFFTKTNKRLFTCSTYQMMILLLFSSTAAPNTVLTLAQILDLTGVSQADIQDHLLSLCHPKNNKILLKNPNVNALAEGDKFMLNNKFESTMNHMNVQLFRKERKDEDDTKAIDVQRDHQMDAAIVRIMKIRKTLKHNQLLAEVTQQLQARFKPNPAHIKKRIEALIEQEYLQRDENDRGSYTYLA